MTSVENILAGVVVTQFIALVVNVAVTRTRVSGISRRVRTLEIKDRDLGTRFVPRPEVEALLRRIEDLSGNNNSLLRAIITAASDRGNPVRTIQAVATPLSIPQAIARQEGFGLANARATRNHNPGNLDFAPWMAEQFGATLESHEPGVVARFAAFPNTILGWAAMHHLLSSPAYLGLTLRAALLKWAPPFENDVSAYEADVCAWTGLAPETIIDEHLV